MHSMLKHTAILFSVAIGAAHAQSVTIGSLPTASDPLPPGTCFPGVQGDVNVILCNAPPTRFGDAFGLNWSPANTVMMNPTGSAGNAAPTALPVCDDVNGAHLVRATNSAMTCGTSTPPAPAALARTRVNGLSFTGTTNTELMAGFGVASPTPAVITLNATGRFQLDIAGSTTTTDTGGSSGVSTIKVYVGTGSPPTAGSPPPSPCVAPTCYFLSGVEPTGNLSVVQSFSFALEPLGLTNSVPIWADLSVSSPTQVPVANNPVLSNVSIRMIEN